MQKTVKKKVAVSACLLGCSCRYDANHNLNETLLELLNSYEIISFCPEDYCFGTPRPTMDLVQKEKVVAISNENHQEISQPIIRYAQDFFDEHSDIELYIGKDRSPSCAVESGKVYDKKKNLLHTEGTGLMSKVALELGIESWDAEIYVANHTS
jgi:uncharacterized protein YbbK (DUF523 family)